MNRLVRRWLKGIGITLLALCVLFGLLQLIPYGRTHSNPPTRNEPAWDSPRTRELVVRACFDCHSNETRWPWYADIAPFSWAVQLDVDNARDIVNFSAWHRPQPLAIYSAHSVVTGSMPPYKYRMAHPEADFTPEERRELIRGLELTLGTPGNPR
jgi:hypothetical protein